MVRAIVGVIALLISLGAQAFSNDTYITLSGGNFAVQGSTQTLTPLTYDPQSGQIIQETYTWSSSNPAAATVSGGVVSGVALGRVTITATGAETGKSKSTTMTVVPTQHDALFNISFPDRSDRSFGNMFHMALSPDGSYITVTSQITQTGLIAPDTLEIFFMLPPANISAARS